jgi:hypothetical protein
VFQRRKIQLRADRRGASAKRASPNLPPSAMRTLLNHNRAAKASEIFAEVRNVCKFARVDQEADNLIF